MARAAGRPAGEPFLTAEPSFAALLAAAAAAALVVGILKTSLGGGMGLVLTPTLSLVLPVPAVLAMLAALLFLGDPISLRYYWRRWDARQLRLLVPTALLGVAAGALVLSRVPPSALRRMIGGVALAFAVVQLAISLRGRRLLGARPPAAAGLGAGLLAGVASALAHSGGVVLGLYLVALDLSNAAIVGTGAAVTVWADVVKVTAYWRLGFLTPSIVLAAVVTAPLMLAGGWLGYRVNRRLPRRAFELALIGIGGAGALRLLLAP